MAGSDNAADATREIPEGSEWSYPAGLKWILFRGLFRSTVSYASAAEGKTHDQAGKTCKARSCILDFVVFPVVRDAVRGRSERLTGRQAREEAGQERRRLCLCVLEHKVLFMCDDGQNWWSLRLRAKRRAAIEGRTARRRLGKRKPTGSRQLNTDPRCSQTVFCNAVEKPVPGVPTCDTPPKTLLSSAGRHDLFRARLRRCLQPIPH
jgi:hypothetical protein